MPSGRSASCLSSARALSTFRLITAKRTNPSDLTSGGFEHFKVGAPSGMSACGWRRPLPLRRSAPCVLRWKTLRVSSAPHPAGFESRHMGSKKPATELVTGFSDSVVPPAGCPRAAGAARFRCVAPLLACCAGKRSAFPQLRTLPGSNPGTWVAKSPLPNW